MLVIHPAWWPILNWQCLHVSLVDKAFGFSSRVSLCSRETRAPSLVGILGYGHILAQQPVELQWACERGHNMRWYGGYGPTGEPQHAIQGRSCSCHPGLYIEYDVSMLNKLVSTGYQWLWQACPPYVCPLSSRGKFSIRHCRKPKLCWKIKRWDNSCKTKRNTLTNPLWRLTRKHLGLQWFQNLLRIADDWLQHEHW